MGDLLLVDVIEKKRQELGGGYYIRYANGGTDTTTEKFLFDVPDEFYLQARCRTSCEAKSFKIEIRQLRRNIENLQLEIDRKNERLMYIQNAVNKNFKA